MTFARGAVVAALVAVVFAVCAEAGDLRPGEKFLWSSYMICFSVSRDFEPFMDRPLDRPPADGTNPRLVDLRNAVDAGIDAFSVDLFIGDKHALGAFGQLAKLIDEHRLPLQLSPMFDGFRQPGVTTEDVVAKVQAWFERFAREPCVVRVEGKPVILTFAAYELSPSEWREVFARLHAAGCDGYWVAEMGRILRESAADLKKAKPWLDQFAGADVFHVYDPEQAEGVAALYRKTYASGSHAWVGDVNIGYWRPEVAVYHSQDGTGQFRRTWQLVDEDSTAWVQQSTWNDFSENHHIMPSENYGTTFVELNRYLAARWKGKPTPLAGPRLYLSQQQEVLVGEEAQFELAALLRPEDVPARLELRITDGEDRTVREFEPTGVPAAGLQTAQFRLRVDDLPSGRLLVPEGRLLDAAGREVLVVRGPYTMVSPGGYRPERNHSWLHTPAHRQIAGLACEFVLDGRKRGSMPQAETKGEVSLAVDSPVELADVEVLHDGQQVLSLGREKVSLKRPVQWEGRIPLNRRGHLDWGAYALRAVTADGRLTTSRPVFVERPPDANLTLGLWTFDGDTDFDVLDSSPWLHDGRLGGRQRQEAWCPERVPDRWGGKCLRFDGVDDRVLVEGPIVPPNAFTVECWVRPEPSPQRASERQMLFATANAAVVLGLEPDGRVFLSRHAANGWHQVVDREPLAPGQWHHVAATCDGATLRLYRDGRLAGDTATANAERCGQIGVGYNPVTRAAFYDGDLDELRLSARPLAPKEFGPHNPPAASCGSASRVQAPGLPAPLREKRTHGNRRKSFGIKVPKTGLEPARG